MVKHPNALSTALSQAVSAISPTGAPPDAECHLYARLRNPRQRGGMPVRADGRADTRMMDLFDRYGAKLTIMADVAEILKFQEYKEKTGRDDYHYEAIAEQLREAVRRGHDVQLHLHASYFNARHENGRWEQDWSEYNFAGLPSDRLNEIVRIGKQYLEDLLQPVAPAYQCTVFRAANWAVSPSRNVVRALLGNGIRVDTSVFKYGQREGIVRFRLLKCAQRPCSLARGRERYLSSERDWRAPRVAHLFRATLVRRVPYAEPSLPLENDPRTFLVR